MVSLSLKLKTKFITYKEIANIFNLFRCWNRKGPLYIYIYIYCHPQTDCFVLSELFSVARPAGHSKPGLKPV